MSFLNVKSIELQEFRPGIMSRAERGKDLIMAIMEISPGNEDPGHRHDFDQCGIVIAGRIEMFIEKDRRTLGHNDAYFIPSGKTHGWKTFDSPVRILDVSMKVK